VIRKPPTTFVEPTVHLADDHEGADQRDAGDGVGGGHQRRVQQGRHARDDVNAEEAGEDKDVEANFYRGRRHVSGLLQRMKDEG
jgi:hypothetical protein